MQGPKQRTLREIVSWLQKTYCRAIGVQFMHIDDLAVREWLQRRMEDTENRLSSRDEQVRILTRADRRRDLRGVRADKYVGAKTSRSKGPRASFRCWIWRSRRWAARASGNRDGHGPSRPTERAGQHHRQEPAGDLPRIQGPGRASVRRRRRRQVSLGYNGDWTTAAGHEVHLSLCFNPSHLEFVNRVAMGRCRAKQDRYGDAAPRTEA